MHKITSGCWRTGKDMGGSDLFWTEWGISRNIFVRITSTLYETRSEPEISLIWSRNVNQFLAVLYLMITFKLSVLRSLILNLGDGWAQRRFYVRHKHAHLFANIFLARCWGCGRTSRFSQAWQPEWGEWGSARYVWTAMHQPRTPYRRSTCRHRETNVHYTTYVFLRQHVQATLPVTCKLCSWWWSGKLAFIVNIKYS